MKYWRTMLIASALGVCGLAVWANDTIRCDGPKTPPPPATAPAKEDPAKDDSLPPPLPATPSDDEPPTRVLDLAASPAPPTLPVAPPVVPPPAPTPAPIPLPPSDPPPLPKSALDLPPAPSAKIELPPAPPAPPPAIVKAELPSPPPTFEVPPAPPTVAAPPLPMDLPPAPVAPPVSPAPPPPPAERIVPVQHPEPPAPPAPVAAKPVSRVAATSGYKLYVRMGGNLGPRFEIRDGDHLLLKVYCERIDLQGMQEGSNILPGLTATGNVRINGSGLNGTCDQLTLASVKGEVVLKGNVRLTCYRGNASSQIQGEVLTFQLKGSEEVPTRTHATSGIVPASN